MSHVPRIRLAPIGPEFSRLIAGCMRFPVDLPPQENLKWIENCVDRGITTFDHADIYGGYTVEEAFGNATKLSPGIRQKMQLISKCGIKLISENRPSHRIKSYDTSKAHIIASVENSLKKLRTDYLDLLLIHRPSPLLNPDEVASAFHQLRDAGKVLHFGVSNFSPNQFDMLHSRFPLVTNQFEASPLHLAPFVNGTLDKCIQHRISPMAWSPFAGGRIFKEGNKTRGQLVRVFAKRLADIHRVELDQIIMAWLLHHPANILPVQGTMKSERIESAIKSLEITLTDEQWFGLWQASTGEEVA